MCYKLITLKIDMFESEIVDERNFTTYEEAKAYSINNKEYQSIIIKISF